MKRRRDTASPWTQRQDPAPRDHGDERPDADGWLRCGTGRRRMPRHPDDERHDDPEELGRWPMRWGR